MSTSPVRPDGDAGQPWWRFGHVWLVISGPLVVIVAGFVTLYLAISNPDPVVDADYYRKGVEINRTLGTVPANLAPAVVGRNHAATGAVPLPREDAAAKP